MKKTRNFKLPKKEGTDCRFRQAVPFEKNKTTIFFLEPEPEPGPEQLQEPFAHLQQPEPERELLLGLFVQPQEGPEEPLPSFCNPWRKKKLPIT
jgi:hypothetical protein